MKIPVIVFSFLLSFVDSSTLQSQTLDQSQLNYNAGVSARTLPGYSHFQSFTAGLTGTLVKIEMGVFNFINGSGTLIIYYGSDTTGPVLQTTPVNVNCPSGNCFAAFTVSVPVDAGQVYTFRFIPGNGMPDPYGVQAEVPGTYAQGQFGLIDPSGVYYPGFDQVFKTYVEVSSGIANDDLKPGEIIIAPNPFSLRTTFYFNERKKINRVEIYNSFGKCERVIDGTFNTNFIFERNNLPEGIYFVKFISENGYSKRIKVLICD